MSDAEPPRRGAEDESGIGGLARLAATAAWRSTGWWAETSARAGRRLVEVAIAPEKAGDLAGDVRDAARDAVRELIGYAELEERVRDAMPESGVARRVADAIPDAVRPGRSKAAERAAAMDDTAEWELLRVRGEELMHRSRDVRYVEEAHPAYERMLDELAPDEARILRLLLLNGPQPAIDIRTGGPLALLSSRLIAQGQNMIGARAGCRYVDRVPSYLNNLNRLGLIWFSRETLHNPIVYQVLEAQPAALEAAKSVRMAKVVRRSIHLTPFGEDFCRICLALEAKDLEQLPEHSDPEEE